MSFKKEAQKYQLLYFPPDVNQSKIESKKGRAQKHWLNDIAANNGTIFYSDYGIHPSATKNRKNKQGTPEWFCTAAVSLEEDTANK